MRRGSRRDKARKQKELYDAAPEDAVVEDDSSDDETGWQTTTAGLSGFARLARAAVWVLIATGPLLGGVALLGASAPAQGAPQQAAAERQPSATGPSGFGQLYVTAYLEAGSGTEKSLAPYYSGSITLTDPPLTRSVLRSAVIGAREVSAGYWSVTVAAGVSTKNKKDKYGPARVQYYRVGVQALGPKDAGGAATSADAAVGYAATSLPAQVAAPTSLAPSGLGYGTSRGSASSDPATETASGFLNAYLADNGELDRYTSPGVRLQPVTPAPYTEVKITDVDDNSPSVGDQKVPGDGTTRRLLVTVEATDADERAVSLSYALELTARANRWEVSALEDAPLLKPDSQPSTAPTAPSDPDGLGGDADPTPSSS